MISEAAQAAVEIELNQAEVVVDHPLFLAIQEGVQEAEVDCKFLRLLPRCSGNLPG